MTVADKPIKNAGLMITSFMLVAAIVFLQIYFMGRAITGLAAGLVIAWLVWMSGTYKNKRASKRLLLFYSSGIIIQCLHFAEEYYTGFQQKFPMLLFDYVWSGQLFFIFNLCWLLVFIVSGIGIWRQNNLAYLFVWFFVLIGEIGNGIFHPLLSLYSQSYFPGLYTSFLHLVNGIFLFKELRKLVFI